MQIKNSWKTVLLVLPICGILAGYFLKKTDPFVIVDPIKGFDTKQFKVTLQTDSLSGGSSTIALSNNSFRQLSYSYTLNNKVNAPLVRLIIESTHNSFFDLTPYNKLSMTVKSEHGKQIPLAICNAIPYHSHPDEINSYHVVVHYARVTPAFQTQELELEDFTTPDWWYAFGTNKQYQNEQLDVSLAKYLFFTNTAISNNFQGDQVTISELKFEYKFTSYFIRAGIISGIYYLLCLLLFYFPKFVGVEKVYLWYKKIDTVNYEEADKNRLLTYLQNNFYNPELTIVDVQNETGIHQRKISGIIKKDSQLSFKAYLNQLRIEKAKSLLAQSDLSISAIAFESGYNSVSHFNRVFKSEVQVSPQDYRHNQNAPDLVI